MKSYINFLGRNKLYTAIEAVGLILSLGFAILIGSYVYLHTSIAYENPDHDRIYTLNRAKIFLLGSQDKPIVDASIPEVDLSARIAGGPSSSFTLDEQIYRYESLFADSEFFEMFPYYDFIVGSPYNFRTAGNVIISETFANMIAESPEAAVGTQFLFSNYGCQEQVTVAAVIKDFENTLFPYCDVIFNFQLHDLAEKETISMFGMGMLDVITFFRVKEGTDREEMERKVKGQCIKNYEMIGMTKENLKVRSLSEAYFSDESRLINHSDRNMLRLLTVVVFAILLSAVFNYINLAFALSGKRAKEMATRRLVGAGKADIFKSNIFESIAFTVVSFALALMLAVAMEPLMNRLIAGDGARLYVPVDVKFTIGYVTVYLLSAIAIGTLVGFLPALNASGFKPIDVIKGQFRMTNKRVFTKIFIVVQTSIAVVLISMSILMEVQLSHMLHRPMNMNTENIFMLDPIGGGTFAEQEVLYNEILELPFVKRIGFTTTIPGQKFMRMEYRAGDGEVIDVYQTAWDSTYFRMVNPHVVREFARPLMNSLWMSESTAAAINYSDSTEMSVMFIAASRMDYTAENVGGILEDIPNEEASALEFIPYSFTAVIPREEFSYLNFAIETDSESKEYKEAIMKIHDKLAASQGVVSSTVSTADFISDIQREMLNPVERTIRLVEIFMILSVLLSLLGLLAMSTYFSEQKSKEIAIRKVFGGTITTETLANVRSYMIMVLIACIIGVPVAIYLAGRYLEQFAYRIENYWWIFLLAVLLSFAISLLSVLWQTLKAARTNPSEELKKE